MRRRACAMAVVVLLTPTGRSLAQTAAGQPPSSPQTLTLEEALQYAVDHYPSVRAALEQTSASSSGVAVARSAYLPRLDAVWQSNRATANNVFGQLLPQSVIPSMSGPVLASASGQNVWSSATGALFSWEALDFGLRHASVTGAEATLTRSRANEALTRLDVQNAVGTAFLNVLGAERAVVAAQADLDRREILGRAIQTLVDNQLRPGADASRADAERAAARTRLILVQENLTLARTTLRRVLGVTAGEIAIAGDALIARMPAGEPSPAPAAGHPLAQVRQAAVDQARALEEVLAHTDRPRVFVQSSGFARGSGADPSGVFDGGVGGLRLERANWAAGVQVVLPNLFDYASLRARRAEASASTRAETALHDEALLTISSQQQAATAMLEAARAVAANTPVQLAAAQQSERQARARYDAGLASVIEVADAQNLLAQAEAQDQLARVDVWRALLAGAVAQGDLAPFVNRVRQP